LFPKLAHLCLGGRFQGTCTLLNELLTLPTTPKALGNPRDPSSVSYTPYTPNHVKTQVLITLTTILVTSEAIYRQPSTIESLVDILFEIIMHSNESNDRLLRQTAAEALRELSMHFSGLLVGRLGLLLRLAREERLHAKLSYLSLFSTALASSLQCIDEIATHITNTLKPPTSDAAFQLFETTLYSLGLSPNGAPLRLFDVPNVPELPSFQIPTAVGIGKCYNFHLATPKPFHWIHHFRSELELAANFILEQIPNVTQFEAIRLTEHLIYVLQTSFVSKDTFDDVSDNAIPGLSNAYKSIKVCTELLVRHDRLTSVIRWALQTNLPLLWTVGSIMLSRLPVTLIQPLLSRSMDTDVIPTTQRLTHMLRDNILMLCRHFSVSERLRLLFIEWISRRPLHSDADHCAFLFTTPPTTVSSNERVLTSFHATRFGGSKDLAMHFWSKRLSLCPTAFDSILTAQAKLISLAYCFASTGMEYRIPKSFMRTLSVFNDFPSWFLSSPSSSSKPLVSRSSATVFPPAIAPSNASSRALFQVVSHYLLNFPSIFDSVMQYLECVMYEHVAFSEQGWQLVVDVFCENVVSSRAELAILRLCRFLSSLSPPLLFNYMSLLLKMATIRHAKVDMLLEALRLNLRVSKASSEWRFGNAILEFVHLVLIHHDIRRFLTPACNVLSLLSKTFGDFEIRERAHFYLQLLTHVPADKIRNIIEVTAQTKSENLDVDNPFVNTEAAKLNAAVVTFKSISSASSTSTGPISPPNILLLETKSPYYNLNALDALERANAREFDTAEFNLPVLDFYLQQVVNLAYDPTLEEDDMTSQATSSETTAKDYEYDERSTRVQIPFLLRFKTPAELRNEGGDLSHLPLSLYSLTLKLTGSLLYAHHAHDVSLPFLASRVNSSSELSELLLQDLKGDTQSNTPQETNGIHDNGERTRYGIVSRLLQDEGGSAFPYAYSFVLSLNVLLPLPTMLQVKVLANTDEGAVAEISMDPIYLSLRYLFLPIPKRFTGQYPYQEFIKRLYGEIWSKMALADAPTQSSDLPIQSEDVHGIVHTHTGHFADHQDALALWDDHQNVPLNNATTSVKYISKASDQVQHAIQTHLKPFLVQEQPNEEQDGYKLVKAIIFLPHKYHLLFSFEIHSNHTVIRIRTDWWRILTHIDKYFDEIMMKTAP